MTTLRSLTVPLGELSAPTGMLDYLQRDDLFCWIRRGTGLLGFGTAAAFTATGPERFTAAQQWWQELLADADVVNHVGLAGTGLLAFGSFAFSGTSVQPSRLIVPRLVLGGGVGDTEDEQRWLTYISADPAEELTAEAAEAALARYLEDIGPERAPDPADTLAAGTLSEQQWMEAVADGVARIGAGELNKLVLARDVVARLGSPIATAQVLRELAMRYRDCWTYSVDGLIGSTPEMLIKVENRRARARVLAGTLDRADAPAADPDYAARMLAGSEKQRHEHQLAIDSLTRQLEPFTSSMTSHSEPFVLELPNVWHLASDVVAELSPAGGPGHSNGTGAEPNGTGTAGTPGHDGAVPTSLALAAALHPTAAVCGTPTGVAAELLRSLERMDRGRYAGPVGWIDGAGNGEWGIALRGAVVESPTAVRLYAGCGIVAASEPAAELAETWSKFRPMMEALGVRR